MAKWNFKYNGHTVEAETVDGVGRQPFALVSEDWSINLKTSELYIVGYKVRDLGTREAMEKALKSWRKTATEMDLLVVPTK